jgi:hypothetical protein
MRQYWQWVAPAALGLLAACATKPPPPAPPPVRPVPPPPSPAPPPPPADWRDIPLTAGEWSHAGAEARFGTAAALLIVRCDRATRQVRLSRPGGEGATQMAVTTSTGSRLLALEAGTAALPASDPILDAMVFSRGRFIVDLAGLERLVIPAWPEPARVVEECRG